MTMNAYAISVMTRDRLGVIADVTAAIRSLEGNLADLSQTVRCGYFSMIVFASFPDEIDETAIRQVLQEIPSGEVFEISMKRFEGTDLDADPAVRGEGEAYVLSVSGPDRVGFVAAVTGELATRGINVEDVDTTVRQGRYIMFLLIRVPNSVLLADLRASLAHATSAIGAEFELQHDAIFRATNEIG